MNIAEKLTKMAENTNKVYTAGLDMGYRAGYDMGYQAGNDAGKSSVWCDYDAFWDGLQDLGDRTSYNYAFGTNWTDDMFVPKHRIAPTENGADDMFNGSNITNLSALLKNPELQNANVALDFSNSKSLRNTFANSKVVTLPDIDTGSCTDMTRTFYGATDLKAINFLFPKKDGGYNKDTVYDRTFDGCESLETVTLTVPGLGNVVGMITKVADARGLYFGDSPNLTGDSVMNIISALGPPAESTESETYVSNVVFHPSAYTRGQEVYEESALRPYYTWDQFVQLATDGKWTITTN
jgi:hypothetical protein